MPNKRAKNKVFFGGFIDRRFKAAVQKAAKKAGMGHDVFAIAISLAHPSSKPPPAPHRSPPLAVGQH